MCTDELARPQGHHQRVGSVAGPGEPRLAAPRRLLLSCAPDVPLGPASLPAVGTSGCTMQATCWSGNGAVADACASGRPAGSQGLSAGACRWAACKACPGTRPAGRRRQCRRRGEGGALSARGRHAGKRTGQRTRVKPVAGPGEPGRLSGLPLVVQARASPCACQPANRECSASTCKGRRCCGAARWQESGCTPSADCGWPWGCAGLHLECPPQARVGTPHPPGEACCPAPCVGHWAARRARMLARYGGLLVVQLGGRPWQAAAAAPRVPAIKLRKRVPPCPASPKGRNPGDVVPACLAAAWERRVLAAAVSPGPAGPAAGWGQAGSRLLVDALQRLCAALATVQGRCRCHPCRLQRGCSRLRWEVASQGRPPAHRWPEQLGKLSASRLAQWPCRHSASLPRPGGHCRMAASGFPPVAWRVLPGLPAGGARCPALQHGCRHNRAGGGQHTCHRPQAIPTRVCCVAQA